MKYKIMLIFVLILISSVYALEPGKLWINDVFIPSGLEKEIELEKPTIEPKQISYVYANGQRIAKIQNGEVFYFHNDHLGSPRVITNSKGEIVEKIDYLPFGESFNKNEKISYNSKELDKDTGLNYYGARYYNAPVGRFITADTVKGILTDPQSLNLYVYVKNNPMKFIDPTGNKINFAPGTEKYKGLIKEMELYKQLHSNKKAFFEFVIRDSLSEKGIFAAFSPKWIGNYPKGTIYVPSLSKAKEKATIKEIKTTLYHELFHAKQEIEIKKHLEYGSRIKFGLSVDQFKNVIPEWKYDFYFAQLSRKQSEKNIGAELEAHYKTVLYEKKRFGEVGFGSTNLGSFFMYFMEIQQTKEYEKYEEIRHLTSVYSNVIKQTTGYDLESYMEEYKEQKRK